jgi:hypothetical protein
MSALSPAALALLDRVLQTPPPAPEPVRFSQRDFPGLRVSLTPATDDRQVALLEELLDAVHWPQQLPLEAQLTPAQRAVAVALSGAVVDVGDGNVRMPAQRAIRRRWLGLDPPTALERAGAGTGLPLWALLADGRPVPTDLSVLDRLCLAHDVALDAYGLSHRSADVLAGLDAAVDAAVVDDVARTAVATWAAAAADHLVALFAAPALWVERGRTHEVPTDLARLLTRTLARAGAVIEASLVGLVRFDARALADASVSAAAIAPAARARAIVDAAAPLFANERVVVLLDLVKDHISDAVVDAIFDAFNDAELTRPRAPLYAALRDAVTDPSFVPYVARRLDALPKPHALRCRPSVTPPDASQLTSLQRAQVAVGAEGIQGCGTDWINDEELPLLELFAIDDDAGVHRYDAAILMDEDGVIFPVGETEPVAWLCQHRLDCANVGLKDGLVAALAARSKPR